MDPLRISITLALCAFAARFLALSAELSDDLSRGRELASHYCSACHLLPAPDLLDRKAWRDQVLRRMKIRMGLSQSEIDHHPEAKLLRATGIFPTSPIISTQDWDLIFSYYVASAPEIAPPQDPHPPIQIGLPLFTPEAPKYRRPIPSTTLVRIDAEQKRIYMGDAESKSLDILDPDGGLIETLRVNNTPVSLSRVARGLYVTSIGHFQPSEDPKASLQFFERANGAFKPPAAILEHLPRTTCTEFADLNGDGRVDFAICMYGNNAGRFSWFENRGGDNYEEHVLMPKSGAIRTEIHDFNGDGFPDLAVLMAQETESLFLLFNDGKGHFTQRAVFQKHPLMGHTSFETVDFNRDGKLDFIVTNGDNGEYPSPLKKYHGVRIYLNRGGNQFEEAYFYPLNGAYKALARDFDGDGDLDIAAISFFPDYKSAPEESFVYLENRGNLTFTASTFAECAVGRWLTMDCGDLDGDGDLDVVLGSYIRGPSPVPPDFARAWVEEGPSVLILRNHLRDSKQ